MRFLDKRLILVGVLAICPSHPGFGQGSTAKSHGAKSPAIVGDHNTVIYVEKTYLVETTPQASPRTRRVLREKAKVFLGKGWSGNGLLLPAKDPNPMSSCKQPPKSLTIYFGKGPGEISCSTRNSCVLIGDNSKEGNQTDANSPSSLLSLVKVGGSYQLEGKILGPSGRVVALFINNKIYTYRPEISMVNRPDPASLKILDTQGDVIFNLRYLNPHAMSLSGIFYLQSGRALTISDNLVSITGSATFPGICLDDNGSGIRF
jgi:hypothetical protein